MGPNFDAVVVGAGHNGLVAANYLARAGLSVGVFERRPVVGGAAVTEELWKGYHISRLSYAYGLFDRRIVRDLGLGNFGLRVLSADPDIFVPFPDGKYIFFWNSAEKTAAGIRNFSEADAEAYFRYLAFWKRVSRFLVPLMRRPPRTLSELAGSFAANKESEEVFRTLMFSSVSDLLDEFFESDYVKAAICPRGLIGTMIGPRTPGGAYVLAHHMVGESTGEAGVWGYLKGGMGAVSSSLALSATSRGVKISTGTGVKRILVRQGRAVGVELEDGRKVRAKIGVVSNAAPQPTFLQLVGEDHLTRGFARSVIGIRDEGCVVKVNAALRELADYRCLPGKKVGPQHKGITSIGPTVDYCERSFDEAKYGRPSKHPFLRVGYLSANDPDVAPRGRHTLSIFAQYFPYTLSKGRWDEIREEVGDVIIDTLSEYAPNIKRALIRSETLTPLDLEREFSLPRGNIFHMEITPDQMFSFRPVVGWSDYRTPIAGLYLCGSGAQPGGGVTGTPGYNCARAVLSDLRRREQSRRH